MHIVQRIALAIIIIGAINWGLIGFFNFDLVATLFGGQDSVLSRIIYSLVGLSGIIGIVLLFKDWTQNSDGFGENRLNYGTEFGEEEDFDEFYYDR